MILTILKLLNESMNIVQENKKKVGQKAKDNPKYENIVQ